MRDQKKQTKRQLVEETRRAAQEGRWEDAIDLNQKMVDRSPRDAEAHNRIGRALLELHRLGPAIEAYSSALRADPANMIARRNLQRLDVLRRRLPADDAGIEEATDSGEATTLSMPRTTVFIEEIGKTWVDELINPAPEEELAAVLSAEQLVLEAEGTRLIVKRRDGRRLGEIEAKTAERVVELLNGGNRYEVYALGLSRQSLRVILREVYRNPAQASNISFPRQITSRAYLRERDLLRQRDEADFFMLDDDELEEEEEATTPDADEDEPSEPEAEAFIGDTVRVDEEEPTI